MKKSTMAQKKMGKVMGEYKAGSLHSGKGGPVVTNRKQAVAIAMSEAAGVGSRRSPAPLLAPESGAIE